MRRDKRWWLVFDVLKNYATSQEDTEQATDEVIAALQPRKRPATKPKESPN